MTTDNTAIIYGIDIEHDADPAHFAPLADDCAPFEYELMIDGLDAEILQVARPGQHGIPTGRINFDGLATPEAIAALEALPWVLGVEWEERPEYRIQVYVNVDANPAFDMVDDAFHAGLTAEFVSGEPPAPAWGSLGVLTFKGRVTGDVVRAVEALSWCAGVVIDFDGEVVDSADDLP